MRVFAIGETVLDIIFKNNVPVSAKAGGSMLNSSVSLGRLGVDMNFISDYGNDEVGHLIDDFLQENRVNTDNVIRFENKSPLALAFLDESNNATYSFYKDYPEKRFEGLSIDFQKGDCLLFGSIFSITDSVRDNLLKLLTDASRAGVTIIYDPNFRKPHLHELERVKPWIIENISFADIVKGSDEDFELIFNAGSVEEAYQNVRNSGCENLVYTAGPKDVSVKAPGVDISSNVPEIVPVSSIGAGDNFNAGIIWTIFKEGYTKKDLEGLPSSAWKSIIENGISFAADVCMQYGNYISPEFVSKIQGV